MYQQMKQGDSESLISVADTLDPAPRDGIEVLTDTELQAVSGAMWSPSWRSGSTHGTDEWVNR
jgi:hypothetical protein